jgi:hypothetical protein
MSDMFNVRTFALAARLLAGFYIDQQGCSPEVVRFKVSSHARFSLDNDWRGILPVPFDQAQQETVYEAMMRAVDEVLATGMVVPPSEAKLAEKASMIATFLMDHDPLTRGPEEES